MAACQVSGHVYSLPRPAVAEQLAHPIAKSGFNKLSVSFVVTFTAVTLPYSLTGSRIGLPEAVVNSLPATRTLPISFRLSP